jgi:ribosome-associated translation inhibitor RaiA
MNLAVRTQGLEPSGTIDAFTREQIHGSMKRLSDEILSVDVFVKDTNGPKGGIDKQVVLRIRLRGGQQLALQALREDLFAAISVAAKRARRAVRRHLGKTRRIEKVSLRSLVGERHFEEAAGS